MENGSRQNLNLITIPIERFHLNKLVVTHRESAKFWFLLTHDELTCGLDPIKTARRINSKLETVFEYGNDGFAEFTLSLFGVQGYQRKFKGG